jgi:hypothetical protein
MELQGYRTAALQNYRATEQYDYTAFGLKTMATPFMQ